MAPGPTWHLGANAPAADAAPLVRRQLGPADASWAQAQRDGARLAAYSGRACRSPDQVRVLDLHLKPGARELVLDAAPLGMKALAAPGDARYRNLVLRDGQMA